MLRSFWLKLKREIGGGGVLHDLRELWGFRFNILLIHMFMAASLLVAGYWNSTRILLWLGWLGAVRGGRGV